MEENIYPKIGKLLIDNFSRADRAEYYRTPDEIQSTCLLMMRRRAPMQIKTCTHPLLVGLRVP
jgi:hypothetical protein